MCWKEGFLTRATGGMKLSFTETVKSAGRCDDAGGYLLSRGSC